MVVYAMAERDQTGSRRRVETLAGSLLRVHAFTSLLTWLRASLA
jgi:hypothetical protein